jgi:hypothetical protein
MKLQMKQFSLMVLCALLVCTAGCKNDSNPPDPVPQPSTLYGNIDRPSWCPPEGHDMTSSMTVLVLPDLRTSYPSLAADHKIDSEDMFGAFAGNQCLGVASIVDSLFYLYIDKTEGAVTLRYWSKQYRNLFELKDAFVFVNDGHKGTVNAPYLPALILAQ